jgi:hypothetical protein
MINRTMIDDDFLGLDSSMKAPVVTSAILHIILFIVTAFGIPLSRAIMKYCRSRSASRSYPSMN